MATGIAPKQQSDTGLQLLQYLIGNNETSTVSSNSDVSGARGVLDRVSNPMSQSLYDNLIASIFQQSAQSVPELTQALAGSIGTRRSGNSALALALNNQNNQAAQAAASAILAQNNKQNDQALQASQIISQGTGSKTQQTKSGMGLDPITGLLGGMALNYANKKDLLGKATGWLEDGFSKVTDAFTPATMQQPDLSYLDNIIPSTATGFGGVGTDASVFGTGGTSFSMPEWTDFSSLIPGAGDFGTSLGNLASGASDWASSAWDTVSSWWPFADGGNPGMTTQMRPSYAPAIQQTVFGYADGGMPQRAPMNFPAEFNPMLQRVGFDPMSITSRVPGFADGGRASQIDAAEMAAVNGQDPNAAIRAVVQSAMQPVGPNANPNILGFIQYLLNSGKGIHRNQYADGGTLGATDMMYADGNIIRNKNYMGNPLQKYGLGAIDAFATGGGNGVAGVSLGSSVLGDMFQRNNQRAQVLGDPTQQGSLQGSGTGGVTYRGSFTDQDFADLKDVRDLWGGLAPGEVDTLKGMLGFALNPSLFGFAKLAYDGYQNSQKTMNAIEFYRDNIKMSPEQLKAQEDQMEQNELDAIAQMQADYQAEQDAAYAQAKSAAESAPGGFYGGSASAMSSGGAGSSGEGTSAATGGNNGDASGGGDRGTRGGFADGGLSGSVVRGVIKGPGNGSGIDDLIPAKISEPGGSSLQVSSEEMIIPKDTVDHFGQAFFQDLISRTHKPVRR